MTTLLDIREAKAIGKSIANLRRSKNLTMQSLADLTQFNIQQIVNIENGNHFAFNGSLKKFISAASNCLNTLNDADLGDIKEQLIVSNHMAEQNQIPVFLKRVF